MCKEDQKEDQYEPSKEMKQLIFINALQAAMKGRERLDNAVADQRANSLMQKVDQLYATIKEKEIELQKEKHRRMMMSVLVEMKEVKERQNC